MVDALGVRIGLADGGHGDGGEYAGIRTLGGEHPLHGQRVHDGRHDTHVVRRNPVHALGRSGQPPENIAAADHQGDLLAGQGAGDDFVGQTPHGIEIDAIGLRPHEDFAGKLEKNAFICGDGHFSFRESVT